MMIFGKFGITMINGGENWSFDNLRTVYRGLNMIDQKLNNLNGDHRIGSLRRLVHGTTFTLAGGGNDYYGITNSTGVTFHVSSASVDIPLVNILHETGHLIDAVPATKDFFSSQLPDKPTWVVNGYVNDELLLGKLSEPIQAKPMNEPYSPDEYWADAFANYVADNINKDLTAGNAMSMDVAEALNSYFGP